MRRHRHRRRPRHRAGHGDAAAAEPGAWVAGCDRHDEIDSSSGSTSPPSLDVAVTAGVPSTGFVADVVAARARIDVLVNNAGGTFVAPLLDSRPGRRQMLVAENSPR